MVAIACVKIRLSTLYMARPLPCEAGAGAGAGAPCISLSAFGFENVKCVVSICSIFHFHNDDLMACVAAYII